MSNVEPVAVPETLVAFRSDYPSSSWLVQDLEKLSRDKQVDELVTRFKESKFRWNGRPVPEADFLKAGGDCEGDCATIAGAFVATAVALGFTDARRNDYAGPMFVAGGGAVMGGAAGNIDGGPDWYFDDHHTATADGREFDLLFRGKEGKPVYVQGTSERVEAGSARIEKWTFPGDIVVYEGKADDLANRYTRSFDKACQAVGANLEYVASITKPPTSDKAKRWEAIADRDEKIRRDGVAEYVRVAKFPDKPGAKMVDFIMQKFTGPIEDDADLYEVLNQACDDMGEFKEDKWKAFAQENGLSIFRPKA
jgi:hypothetical protein